MPVSIVCSICGKTRLVPPSAARRYRFCSIECRKVFYTQTSEEERRAKQREHSRRWREQHPEKAKEVQRRYYETHTEQRKENSRKWREGNRKRDKRRNRLYQRRNKMWRRVYLDANRPKTAEQQRRYHEKKPSMRQAINQRRRARLMAVPGSYTPAEWDALCVFYDHTCLCCGRREPEIKLTADHVVPLSKGGSNGISNIQPLCQSCNSRKHTATIDFRIRRIETQNTLWEFMDDSHSVTG